MYSLIIRYLSRPYAVMLFDFIISFLVLLCIKFFVNMLEWSYLIIDICFYLWFVTAAVFLLVIIRATFLMLSSKRYGYIRFDGVYEMHIGSVNSEEEFKKKYRKTYKFAKENRLLVECITNFYSVEEWNRRFGPRIVRIEAVKLGHRWAAFFLYIFSFWFSKNKSFADRHKNNFYRVLIDFGFLSK